MRQGSPVFSYAVILGSCALQKKMMQRLLRKQVQNKSAFPLNDASHRRGLRRESADDSPGNKPGMAIP
jgi:hypothetical protein